MLLPAPRLAPLPGTPRAGVPLVGEFVGEQGDLRGEESELEGVAGHFEPLTGEPLAGDLHAGDQWVFTPNILAALSRSESELRNLGDR